MNRCCAALLTACLAICGLLQAALALATTPKAVAAAAENQSNWTLMALADLVKRVGADCTVQGRLVIACAGPIRIQGLARTRVTGHGVRVEFADARPGNGGIILADATDVKIGDVELGWLDGGARDPLIPGVQRIQSLGNVVACKDAGAGAALALDLPLEGTQPIGAATVWDDARGWPWYPAAPDAVEIYFPAGTQGEFTHGRSTCFEQLAALVGRRVLVRHLIYANHAFQCWHCRNVTVENVRITSAPGMGFLFSNGGSRLALRHDSIEPGCYPRCAHAEPSIAADGVHFAGVQGPIVLENNDIGWQGDDSINITGILIPARAAPATPAPGRLLQVPEPFRSRLASLKRGSRILIFDQGLSALGDSDVVSSEPSTGQIRISRLTGGLDDLIIAAADGVPQWVTIRNNRFHDNRARGLLIGAFHALIENNDIERVTGAAILIPADTGPWFEGPGAQNVIIKNNRISDVNRYADARNYPSAISAGVSIDAGHQGPVGTPIRHILVENNTLSRVYSNPDKPVSFGKGVADGRSH